MVVFENYLNNEMNSVSFIYEMILIKMMVSILRVVGDADKKKDFLEFQTMITAPRMILFKTKYTF